MDLQISHSVSHAVRCYRAGADDSKDADLRCFAFNVGNVASCLVGGLHAVVDILASTLQTTLRHCL